MIHLIGFRFANKSNIDEVVKRITLNQLTFLRKSQTAYGYSESEPFLLYVYSLQVYNVSKLAALITCFTTVTAEPLVGM